MKIVSALLFFFSLPSWAGQWASIEADHANLLYNEGESARFFVRFMSMPANPEFGMSASVELLGEGDPIDLEISSGVASYLSTPLVPGDHTFRFRVRITGPGDWGRVVEQKDFQLLVNDLE